MATDKAIRVVVITSPEQLDQEWIGKLANESDISHIDRVAVLTMGIEMVQQTRPDLVIIDRSLEEAEYCIRQIYTTLPTTSCIALVSQPDMTVLRRLVTAGARDVIGTPCRYSDLISSVRSVLAMEMDRRSKALVATGFDRRPMGRGKLIVIISPKGGAGTTLVSTNLAIALRQMTATRVALADFGLQFGHVGVHLNLWSRHTLQDLLEKPEDIDDAMLSTVMQQHSSGVHVLLAPNSPDVAADVTRENLSIILDRLLERYSYVVADTWCVLDEVTMSLLQAADEVLVVTTPEVPALKNVKFFLEYLRQNSMTDGRVAIVLNRFPSVDSISLEDVQQHLRHQVSANIPSAGALVTYSINRGVPVVLSHPQSWVAQSLRKLAAHVAGEKVNTLLLSPESRKGKERSLTVPGTYSGFLNFLRREA